MSSANEPLVQIEDPSRRDALRSIALAVTLVAGGQMKLEAAQHVHARARDEKKKTGSYAPKLFNDHEFKTLGRLAELIIPADTVSGSARDAGAPEFIDLLASQNEDLAAVFTGGLSWLDAEMRTRYSVSFVGATAEQQTAMLDSLVEAEQTKRARAALGQTYEASEHYRDFRSYGTYGAPGLGPGVAFFGWMRKMAVDAFYTSEIGIKDVDFRGNATLSEFEVPKAAIDHALKHSPFAG
ncbi:MAG: gluconate 2-dehydrogenase subunit 3 family protein [Acidimicrobiia bacterium]|nr:gluconate 2-dehydrogenase subunit 3 family protein [Acidimicrobiia bacterium]